MSDGYRRQRTQYQDISGGLQVGAFTATTTLASPRTVAQAIYVQKVHLNLTGVLISATWTIQDSTGVVIVGPLPVSTIAGAVPSEYDFGAFGIALTVGASLQFVPSTPGATGVVTWEGYRRVPAGVAVTPALA